MKLAILEADILHDSLRETHVGYGRMFQDLLRRTGMDWDLTIYPVISGTYPVSPDHYDAFLITGSKFDSFADDEWIVRLRQYAQALYEHNRPMVGICFGHQLLAHALGGQTARSDAGWGLGVMEYALVNHPSFVELPGEAAPSSVRLIASHQDQVAELPPQALPLLSSDFCPNAGFYIPGKVLTIQAHPEFNVDYAGSLLELRAGQLTPEHTARVQASFEVPHEGALVGAWIRQFLEQANS